MMYFIHNKIEIRKIWQDPVRFCQKFNLFHFKYESLIFFIKYLIHTKQGHISTVLITNNFELLKDILVIIGDLEPTPVMQLVLFKLIFIFFLILRSITGCVRSKYFF